MDDEHRTVCKMAVTTRRSWGTAGSGRAFGSGHPRVSVAQGQSGSLSVEGAVCHHLIVAPENYLLVSDQFGDFFFCVRAAATGDNAV